jgi:ABC-type Zn uptake system ZnuABC Zn-binding protein ZnuA
MNDEILEEIKEKLVKPENAEYFTKNLSIDL